MSNIALFSTTNHHLVDIDIDTESSAHLGRARLFFEIVHYGKASGRVSLLTFRKR